MSYGSGSPTGWGCLPAAAFGLVFGFPAAFGVLMGECIDETGRVGNCPNEGLELFAAAVLTASFCWLIMWATNRAVRVLVSRGRAAAWGAAFGLLLSAVLLVPAYAMLIWIL